MRPRRVAQFIQVWQTVDSAQNMIGGKIVPARIGSGPGSWPAQPKTPASGIARDMIAVIRALRLQHVDLIGFSLGGFVPQEIALKVPDLARKIILAGCGPAGCQGIDKVGRCPNRVQLAGEQPELHAFFPRPSLAKDVLAPNKDVGRIDHRADSYAAQRHDVGVDALEAHDHERGKYAEREVRIATSAERRCQRRSARTLGRPSETARHPRPANMSFAYRSPFLRSARQSLPK